MGAGLSFTFMMESASALQESNYTRYYGADYTLWADRAGEIVTRYQKELGHCFGQQMSDHKILEQGVTLTVYEDGTEVYVNYNDTEYCKNDITVPAREYMVRR